MFLNVISKNEKNNTISSNSTQKVLIFKESIDDFIVYSIATWSISRSINRSSQNVDYYPNKSVF